MHNALPSALCVQYTMYNWKERVLQEVDHIYFVSDIVKYNAYMYVTQSGIDDATIVLIKVYLIDDPAVFIN